MDIKNHQPAQLAPNAWYSHAWISMKSRSDLNMVSFHIHILSFLDGYAWVPRIVAWKFSPLVPITPNSFHGSKLLHFWRCLCIFRCIYTRGISKFHMKWWNNCTQHLSSYWQIHPFTPLKLITTRLHSHRQLHPLSAFSLTGTQATETTSTSDSQDTARKWHAELDSKLCHGCQ